jgi:hypothetical protein
VLRRGIPKFKRSILKENITMLDDYKLKAPTKSIKVELELEVAETLLKMEKSSQLSQSEITNTALKRFIAHHKDLLPFQEIQKK